MRFPLRWLKQFLTFEITPEVLIETLTMGGLEVEEALDLGMGSGRIVVAEILETRPHPNADKLRLCKVNAGGERPLDIVCGAPNAAPGLRVPCALEGAVLPGGMVIKKSKIRGEASEGMLCAADELGLGADHAGILELPDTYKPGEPFDYLLDIKVTPNRPDCLSVFGMAREAAALLGKKVYPPTARFKETLDHIEGFMRLAVKARTECPRYTCRLIRGVKIAPSPLWLQRTLEACGLRPINNVVDVTNYVLYELGHPLHAFDFDVLAEHEVRVRLAEPGERLALLDGKEIDLAPEDLVIADAQKPVALAGVMGGSASAVTEETVNVLLESAYFDPATIRRTSKRHGVSSDASYRFERGADRQRVVLALHRAAQLIQEIAGGEIAKGQLDQQTTHVEPAPIVLEIERVQKLLGIALTSSEIADALVNLDFEIRRVEKNSLVVAAPSHRVDVTRDVDLIEEVARLHGYNNIPVTMPRIAGASEAPDPLAQLSRHAADTLTGLGFCEAVNFSFIGEAEAAQLGFDAAAQPHLLNPITSAQAIMRPSLLPGLLANAAFNRKQQNHALALFEIGKVWSAKSRAGDPDGEGCELIALLGGQMPKLWESGERTADFFDLKGAAEHLLGALGLPVKISAATEIPNLHPGRAALIATEQGTPLGVLGELHPDLIEAHELGGRMCILALDLRATIAARGTEATAFTPLPRFPASERDLAVVVARETPAADLLLTIRSAAGTLLEDISVFDLYEGEHVAADKKSLAFRLRLRSADETLTDEAIRETTERVTQKLEKVHGAVLRS